MTMRKETITMEDGRSLVYYWFDHEGCGCTEGKSDDQRCCGCPTAEQTS
jgi:hypothetical protein